MTDADLQAARRSMRTGQAVAFTRLSTRRLPGPASKVRPGDKRGSPTGRSRPRARPAVFLTRVRARGSFSRRHMVDRGRSRHGTLQEGRTCVAAGARSTFGALSPSPRCPTSHGRARGQAGEGGGSSSPWGPHSLGNRSIPPGFRGRNRIRLHPSGETWRIDRQDRRFVMAESKIEITQRL